MKRKSCSSLLPKLGGKELRGYHWSFLELFNLQMFPYVWEIPTLWCLVGGRYSSPVQAENVRYLRPSHVWGMTGLSQSDTSASGLTWDAKRQRGQRVGQDKGSQSRSWGLRRNSVCRGGSCVWDRAGSTGNGFLGNRFFRYSGSSVLTGLAPCCDFDCAFLFFPAHFLSPPLRPSPVTLGAPM